MGRIHTPEFGAPEYQAIYNDLETLHLVAANKCQLAGYDVSYQSVSYLDGLELEAEICSFVKPASADQPDVTGSPKKTIEILKIAGDPELGVSIKTHLHPNSSRQEDITEAFFISSDGIRVDHSQTADRVDHLHPEKHYINQTPNLGNIGCDSLRRTVNEMKAALQTQIELNAKSLVRPSISRQIGQTVAKLFGHDK